MTDYAGSCQFCYLARETHPVQVSCRRRLDFLMVAFLFVSTHSRPFCFFGWLMMWCYTRTPNIHIGGGAKTVMRLIPAELIMISTSRWKNLTGMEIIQKIMRTLACVRH
jgi:hypothetical protein